MSTVDQDGADTPSPISPVLEPPLPCIVGGHVAVRLERMATREDCDKHSGVDEEVTASTRVSQFLRQPVSEEAILAASKDLGLPQVRLCSVYCSTALPLFCVVMDRESVPTMPDAFPPVLSHHCGQQKFVLV